MISTRMIANIMVAAGGFGASVLYRYSPQEHAFYPRCPFYALTHRLCPGCGATRALAELVHGHLAAALHYNAAVVALLPFGFWYVGCMYLTAIRENRLQRPSLPDWSWRVALAGIALFAVGRTLAQTIL